MISAIYETAIKKLSSIKISFFVNPDPKTLWTNIPTPTEIEYYKQDSDKYVNFVRNTKKHD